VLAAIVVFVGIAIVKRGPNLLIVSPISATVPAAEPAAPPPPAAETPASAPPAAAEPSKKAPAPAATRERIASSTKSAHVTTTPPLAGTAIKANAAAPSAEPVAAARASASSSNAIVEAGAVTITGCLETSVTADEFRLSDTEGSDAPKARSWKTGFLKKHSSPVVLVAPPDPHGLQAHVGKRVAATGQLTSHELRVSSLRVVGPSCD
jgi:hypothetical protein